MPEVFEGGQKEKETERDKERERDSEKERGRERRRCSVMWHRKAEQLSPESRLSHKLNARLTAVNGTSEKLLLFGCSTH